MTRIGNLDRWPEADYQPDAARRKLDPGRQGRSAALEVPTVPPHIRSKRGTRGTTHHLTARAIGVDAGHA